MADDTDLNAMKDLTQAMYDREYAYIAPGRAREGAILRDLGLLDRLAASGRQNMSETSTMQMIGADLSWQAWQNRAREQLNSELAQLRAQKLAVMSQVRKAFGRDQAIRRIADLRALEQKQEREKRGKLRLLGLE
jgi:hypothetical protein